jgi:hypothetical protein
VALEHAIEVSVAYGREFDGSLTDRLVVNMARHRFTDYDEDQSFERFAQACAAIAERYPWLSGECNAQVARRRLADAQATLAAQTAQRWREDQVERRRARSAEAAQAIGGLALHRRARARFKGHERTGVLTWIGRRRVELAFTLKSGEERRARLYANEVTVLQEAAVP